MCPLHGISDCGHTVREAERLAMTDETITIKRDDLLKIQGAWFAMEALMSLLQGGDGDRGNCERIRILIGKEFSDAFESINLDTGFM